MLRGLDEELKAPKYAHIERERRFLVDPLKRPDLTDAPHLLIEDRYIVNSLCRLRRMTDSATGRIVMKLGKKYGVVDALARPTVTTYLDAREYALFAALSARLLTKRRYPVETASGVFGIDRFEGTLAGLETAEIEFDNAQAGPGIEAPSWTIREITHARQFRGGELAGLDRAAAAVLLATL